MHHLSLSSIFGTKNPIVIIHLLVGTEKKSCTNSGYAIQWDGLKKWPNDVNIGGLSKNNWYMYKEMLDSNKQINNSGDTSCLHKVGVNPHACALPWLFQQPAAVTIVTNPLQISNKRERYLSQTVILVQNADNSCLQIRLRCCQQKISATLGHVYTLFPLTPIQTLVWTRVCTMVFPPAVARR